MRRFYRHRAPRIRGVGSESERHEGLELWIERAVGVSLDALMRMQTSYDIAQVRKREDDIELVPFEDRVA